MRRNTGCQTLHSLALRRIFNSDCAFTFGERGCLLFAWAFHRFVKFMLHEFGDGRILLLVSTHRKQQVTNGGVACHSRSLKFQRASRDAWWRSTFDGSSIRWLAGCRTDHKAPLGRTSTLWLYYYRTLYWHWHRAIICVETSRTLRGRGNYIITYAFVEYLLSTHCTRPSARLLMAYISHIQLEKDAKTISPLKVILSNTISQDNIPIGNFILIVKTNRLLQCLRLTRCLKCFYQDYMADT